MTRGEFMKVWQGWLAYSRYKFTDKQRERLWRRVQDLSADVFERVTEHIAENTDEKYGGRPSLDAIASETRRTEEDEKPTPPPEPEVEHDPAWWAAFHEYLTTLLDPQAAPRAKADAIDTWMNWRKDHGETIDPEERQEMGALYRRYRDEAATAERQEQTDENGN